MKTRTKKIIKCIVGIISLVILLVGGVVAFASWKIPYDTKDYIYSNADSVPAQKTALVLGAARYVSGRQNLYFTYRIQAAKELYEAGKVKAFVVSGDNRWHHYNEAQDMHDALVEAGVPDSIIHMDYAGLRTLDSVVRMNKIFGQDSFIVVSQKFHNERAIFIARQKGLEAYGYNARDLRLNKWSFKTKIREVFARVKVFVDIIANKQPRHMGEPINID